ncbi:MAG: hypothetical protein OXE75_08360 [bacterium]|nr:hypothetical protein [bacterium]
MRRRDGGLETRWTVLAAAGARGALAVDGAGRVVTGRHGWSLDWQFGAGEQLCTPGVAASLRQRTVGADDGAPVALETVARAAGGDMSELAYVGLAAGAGAGALGVVEFANRTSAPVAVTLRLQAGDFWRVDGLWRVEVDGAGALANGSRALWWQRPPAAERLVADTGAAPGRWSESPSGSTRGARGAQRVTSRHGRAAGEFTWPVTHGTALRILLPLEAGDAVPAAPAVVPDLGQVGRGWDLHTAEGLRVVGLGEGRIGELVAAAIRRLLALDIPSGAGEGADGRLSPGERALVASALAVAGHAGRAAEVVSVRAARNPSAAVRLARREAARITEPFGAAAGITSRMAAAAGPGGGWVGERGGDDPGLRAAFLLAVRDTLVSEQGGCLDLLAGADLAGSRPPIEVHRLGTGCGLLSYAIRWHGETPALLWELVPPTTPPESWASVLAGPGSRHGGDAAATTAAQLRVSVLSESWSTRDGSGESLLSP